VEEILVQNKRIAMIHDLDYLYDQEAGVAQPSLQMEVKFKPDNLPKEGQEAGN